MKHKNALLQQLAEQLPHYESYSVNVLEVILHDREHEYTFSLPTFLDYLANDVFRNELGDWTNATVLQIAVL